MADNEKTSVLDTLNSRYKELESQANSVRYGTSKSKVSGIVNKTKKELEKLRRSKFLESKGLDQATDLTKDTALKDEFANYKLDMGDSDVKDFYTAQKNSLIQETNDRNDILNRIYGNKEKDSKGELVELLDDVNKRLSELRDTPEDQKERTELENLVEKIGAKNGGGLLGKLSEDAKKHMSLRRIAVTDFSGAVGEKVNNGAQYVNNDPDVKNSIGSLDKDGHLVTANERATNEDIDRKDEQITQEQSNTSQQPRSAGAGFVDTATPRANSNVQTTGVSPSVASTPVYGVAPQVAPQNNDIGYASNYPSEEYESIVDDIPKNNEKTGMDYINEFLSDDTTFEEKFNLINDNEINNKMIEALKDSDLTNEQRNKIIEFSENPMLTMAMYKLKDSGLISEKQYENVKKDASYAKKYYNSLLKGLPAKKKEIDDLTNKLHRTGKKQDQLKIQEEINALEDEYRAYAPLARLKNFKSATENIKNMSTRLNSLRRTFKNLFVKDDKKYLPASEYEKADSKIDQNPQIKLTEEEFEKEIQEPQKEKMLDEEMNLGFRDNGSDWWQEEKRAPQAVRNVIAIGKKTGRKIERVKKKTDQYKEKLRQATIVSWSDKIKETKLKAQATMAGVTKYSPEEIDAALKNGNRLTEEKLSIIKNQQAIWGRKAPVYFTQKEAEFTKQLEDEQMNRRIEAKKLLRNADMSYEEKMAEIDKLKTEYTSRFMKVPDEYTAMENIVKDAQLNTTRERKGINEKNGDIGRKTSFEQALIELNWNHDANYEKRSNAAVDGLDDFDFESELKKDYTEQELSWMEKNAKEYLDSVNERDAKKDAQEEKQRNQSKYKYKSNKKVKNMKNYKERQEKNNETQR